MGSTVIPASSKGVLRDAVRGAKWRMLGAYDNYHDRRLNIDASGLIDPKDLQHSGSSATYSYVYLGTPHSVLDIALSRLPIDMSVSPSSTSGRDWGRVVARAAEYPFARVEGVELSDRLQNAC